MIVTVLTYVSAAMVGFSLGLFVGSQMYRKLLDESQAGWKKSLDGWEHTIDLLIKSGSKKVDVKSDSVVSPIQIKGEF